MSTTTVPTLTDRELQVLHLAALGYTNARIGQTLYLGVDTVKTYLRRLLVKLDARDRAHAVTQAFRHGLLRIEGGLLYAGYSTRPIEGRPVKTVWAAA